MAEAGAEEFRAGAGGAVVEYPDTGDCTYNNGQPGVDSDGVVYFAFVRGRDGFGAGIEMAVGEDQPVFRDRGDNRVAGGGADTPGDDRGGMDQTGADGAYIDGGGGRGDIRDAIDQGVGAGRVLQEGEAGGVLEKDGGGFGGRTQDGEKQAVARGAGGVSDGADAVFDQGGAGQDHVSYPGGIVCFAGDFDRDRAGPGAGVVARAGQAVIL